jgi:hypothetical protein
MSAFAATWKQVATFPTVVAEIDIESVRVHGGLVEGTFRFNHSTPQESRIALGRFVSAEVQLLFDCKQKRYASYHRTEFEKADGQGAVVVSRSVSKLPTTFVPVTEGAMDEQMLQAICSAAPS